MVMGLWALGAGALLVWFLWNSQRLWTARRRIPEGSAASQSARLDESVWSMVRRDADPVMESLRRRVWLSFAAWVLYALLGDLFWRAVVSWLNP